MFNSLFRRKSTYKRFKNSPAYDLNYFIKLFTSRNSILLGLGAGTFYLANLHEAPFTKRLRFIWVPRWIETKAGDWSYRSLMRERGADLLPSNHPVNVKVTSIMNNLLTTAIANSQDQDQINHLKSLNWSVNILKSDPHEPPNAFILPNGKVFVLSSILPLCKNDDALATILAHELSHQLARHSGEQILKLPFFLLLAASDFTKNRAFNRLTVDGLLQMPNSREMETEADRIGCEIMSRLCYDPNEAVNFWIGMNKITSQDDGWFQDFFATHPNSAKRINDIRSWLPELQSMRDLSNCYEKQFLQFDEHVKKFIQN